MIDDLLKTIHNMKRRLLFETNENGDLFSTKNSSARPTEDQARAMHSCVNLEHHGMSRTRNQSPIKVLTFAYVAEKSYAHVPIEVSLESSPEASAGTSLA